MRSKHTARPAIPPMPVPPTLSDEAAVQILHFLRDSFLWFSATYRDQIRHYYEPWHHGSGPRAPRFDDPF
ncbi:hypothetical protein [Cupriavidus sp. BIC8F]|uniref:hypothetical protein n=1 Tax=Cupriavidus sp. BIC8F TaxID=3079014 RepID=UPI002916513D|nr:hypothetical protein [Cupriavidus sp. BIC8F]